MKLFSRIPWRQRAPASSEASFGRPLHPLVSRIAALRQDGAADVMEALAAEAPDPAALVEELGRLLEIDTVKMQALTALSSAFDLMPFAEVVQRRCALLTSEDGSRWCLVTDPFDTDLIAWIRSRFGQVNTILGSTETFEAWLAHAEQDMSALGAMTNAPSSAVDARRSDQTESLSPKEIGADESPAVRFVNSTLYDSLKTGASDIHLEADPAGMAVKFRIDGVLTAMRRIDQPDLAVQAINRIKVMAQLDIAERRVPQDGRLQITFSGRRIDVRVSIMPSIHGEDAVLRILDREHLAQSLAGLTLAKLGFDEPAQHCMRSLCRKPHGMLLVTGPTGSGKTTTLYAAIAETHDARDKIITIEDPVEYQLPGVLQIPVNERKGLTFARGLRSILRHDPDKILVGEIRDAETAQIAVQSALTGHLVFTTVHANTVFDVVGRFGQFGIDAYTLASAVNGVLAQRLLRRVCPHCAEPTDAPQLDGVESRRLPNLDAALVRWVRARGCERCRGTGYSGRFALAEFLVMSPTLKALIAARSSQAEIQQEALRTGWRELREQALEAAMRGHTTMEEVDRVAA